MLTLNKVSFIVMIVRLELEIIVFMAKLIKLLFRFIYGDLCFYIFLLYCNKCGDRLPLDAKLIIKHLDIEKLKEK